MSILVWPVVVLIIALVVVAVFRTQLGRLLDRTSKISTKGLEATAASQETAIEKKSGAEELLAVFERSKLMAEYEQSMLRELEIRRVDSPAEREKVLLRHLAAANINAHFSNIYQAIYGTQLTLMQHLNANSPVPKEIAKTSYDVAVMMWPEFYANYTFEQWLNFLVVHGLVQAYGDLVSITVAGREFLKFLIQQGLAFNKPW